MFPKLVGPEGLSMFIIPNSKSSLIVLFLFKSMLLSTKDMLLKNFLF